MPQGSQKTHCTDRRELTTHLIQFRLVQFLPGPRITFQLLRIQLPLRQEADLDRVSGFRILPCRCRASFAVKEGRKKKTYNMDRVLHSAVRPELRLHVAVAKQAHLGIELPSVDAEKATVEVDRREEGHGLAKAGLGAHAGGGSHEEAREGSHCVCVYFYIVGR